VGPTTSTLRPAGRVVLIGRHQAARKLAVAGVTGISQARLTLDANVLGPGYAHGEDVLYPEHDVDALARRPRLTLGALAKAVAAPLALVVRQRDRVAVGEHGFLADPTRDWLGVDALASDIEQRAASARWWPVGKSTVSALRAAWADGILVPLIVSVGGYVVRGYDIIGFDHDTERVVPQDRRAFSLADGQPGWAARLVGCWLASGPGRPLKVWIR
jgi:hypothetical protein